MSCASPVCTSWQQVSQAAAMLGTPGCSSISYQAAAALPAESHRVVLLWFVGFALHRRRSRSVNKHARLAMTLMLLAHPSLAGGIFCSYQSMDCQAHFMKGMDGNACTATGRRGEDNSEHLSSKLAPTCIVPFRGCHRRLIPRANKRLITARLAPRPSEIRNHRCHSPAQVTAPARAFDARRWPRQPRHGDCNTARGLTKRDRFAAGSFQDGARRGQSQHR